MNKFLVRKITDDFVLVRWIDCPWFEEHRLTTKSFVGEHTLHLGKFYEVTRRPQDNFKLSNSCLLDENDHHVENYMLLLDILKSDKKGDPICHLRDKAKYLKITKGRENSFFRSIPAVVAWLIKKRIEEQIAKEHE